MFGNLEQIASGMVHERMFIIFIDEQFSDRFRFWLMYVVGVVFDSSE